MATVAMVIHSSSSSSSPSWSSLVPFASPRPRPLLRRPLSFSSTLRWRCPCPFLSCTTAANNDNHKSRSSHGRRLLVTSESPSAEYIREDYLVKKVSAKEVQELIKGERSVPLIVDFYATWCGPCILMAQELEMLAVEYESNALFVKVDTDDEYEFARDMQVRGLPTLFFISPDPTKDAIRTEGLVPPEMIKNIIDNEM